MRKWMRVLLGVAALSCLSWNTALAVGVPAELSEETGREFSVSGEMGFDGSVLFSEPARGFYDEMRSYELHDWNTEFQLLWISGEYDLTMDYVISWDEREERAAGGEIEPLYYCEYTKKERWLENPKADRTLYYPLIPEEYRYLKESAAVVRVDCMLRVEDKNTGQTEEKVFQTSYFYGSKAENPIVYPDIPDGYRLVRVGEKDTLWSMAAEYLGDPHRYTEIYEANRGTITNPDLIYKNQVVNMPMQ